MLSPQRVHLKCLSSKGYHQQSNQWSKKKADSTAKHAGDKKVLRITSKQKPQHSRVYT